MISGCVVVGVMGVLVVISGSLRADDAHQRTQDALSTLNVALQTYHAWGGQPLPADTAAVVQILRQDPSTQPLIAGLPTAPTDRGLMLLDGYSRPMRYRPAASPDSVGDFVSAGPDGDFGDADAASPAQRRATTDNLYGAERLMDFTPASAPGTDTRSTP